MNIYDLTTDKREILQIYKGDNRFYHNIDHINFILSQFGNDISKN